MQHAVLLGDDGRRREFKHLLLRTFSAPGRFAEHMMIVADLEHGSADAVEDAIIGAWELQSGR